MSADTPRYVHISQAAYYSTLPIATLIAGFAFWWWDVPNKIIQGAKDRAQAQLAIEQMRQTQAQTELTAEQTKKSSVEAQLSIEQIKLSVVQAQEKLETTRHSRALADRTEAENTLDRTPVLTVRPVVNQSCPQKDVREIRLEPHFENKGKVDVTIEEIEVEAFYGGATGEFSEVVERTTEMFDLENTFPHESLGASDDEPTKQRRQRFQELSEKCPHGSLFPINSDNKDIEWKKIDTQTKRTNIRLQPMQDTFEPFVYIATDAHVPHLDWFRFCIKIKSSGAQQKFEFVVPVFQNSGERYQTSTVYDPGFGGGASSVWEPKGSLMPILE